MLKSRKSTFFFLIIAALAVPLVVLGTSPAQEHRDDLRGPAFSDPSDKTGMPGQWERQGIGREDWAEGADVSITLDQHLYAILLPMIKKYGDEKGLKIAVKEGTCGISAGLIIRKAVNMAGFCCPPGKSDRLPGLRYHTLGIAPLALIVHPDNPISDITLSQARRIFQGEIADWSELMAEDGRPGPRMLIRPVGRLHCKARPGHWRLLLDNEDLFGPNLREVGTILDMMISVSEGRNSIGHVATWNIYAYRNSHKVKPLKIDGISPYDLEALLKLRYPFYRPYSITTWAKDDENPLIRDLIQYLMDHAAEVDENFGMIPAARLKAAGWKFSGDELVGEPR